MRHIFIQNCSSQNYKKYNHFTRGTYKHPLNTYISVSLCTNPTQLDKRPVCRDIGRLSNSVRLCLYGESNRIGQKPYIQKISSKMTSFFILPKNYRKIIMHLSNSVGIFFLLLVFINIFSKSIDLEHVF